MNIQPTVKWEVWRQTSGGEPKSTHMSYFTRSGAKALVKEMNDSERENAKKEQRIVRTRWFIVKGTTTYEVAQ